MQRRVENKKHLVVLMVSVLIVCLLLLALFQFCQIRLLRDEFDTVLRGQLTSLKTTHPSSGNSLDLCSYENHDQNSKPVFEDISRGVCLIQGEYLFVDSLGSYVSWNDLRGVIAASNVVQDYTDDRRNVDIQYTGSGFLVDDRGYIITNKHVALPWVETSRDRQIIGAGFKPKMIMFRAFFPGVAQPFELEYITSSDQDDIAILKIKEHSGDIPVLECEYSTALTVGMPLTILGYPTGFDLLTARIGSGGTELKYSCFDDLGTELAGQNLIRPMATSGICGQVTYEKIAYDAATAIGASGAPVLNRKGKVIAVNTALLKGFSGTNFGVPVSKVKYLLDSIK